DVRRGRRRGHPAPGRFRGRPALLLETHQPGRAVARPRDRMHSPRGRAWPHDALCDREARRGAAPGEKGGRTMTGAPVPEKKRVTVVVADDHPLYREGVVRALSGSGRIEVVAETQDGRSALAGIR